MLLDQVLALRVQSVLPEVGGLRAKVCFCVLKLQVWCMTLFEMSSFLSCEYLFIFLVGCEGHLSLLHGHMFTYLSNFQVATKQMEECLYGKYRECLANSRECVSTFNA